MHARGAERQTMPAHGHDGGHEDNGNPPADVRHLFRMVACAGGGFVKDWRWFAVLAAAGLLRSADTPPRFREHTVATGLGGGYQVVLADLNHDGKPDLIALSTRASELVWFENPTWERHVLAAGVSRMINCVPVGSDADGIPEIVLASEFDNRARNSAGVISVLRHEE